MDQRSIVTAVISSLIVAAVFFITGYLIGCASGWFGHRHKTTTHKNFQAASPLYEDLHVQTLTSGTPGDLENAFELKENVAYGPVRP